MPHNNDNSLAKQNDEMGNKQARTINVHAPFISQLALHTHARTKDMAK